MGSVYTCAVNESGYSYFMNEIYAAYCIVNMCVCVFVYIKVS